MTLSLAFHDAKAMVSFSLLGLQARSLAFNPLDVHGPSHKYIIPCASLPGNSSPIIPQFFWFLNFEGSGEIFPVPTSWVLFLCFVFFFFLLLCPQTFASVCRSCAVSKKFTHFLQAWVCQLSKFAQIRKRATSSGFCFFLPRMLHDCCRFAVLLFYPFSAPQVFHVGFQGSIFAYSG